MKFFNISSIKSAENLRIAPAGYKYGFIKNIFFNDIYSELLKKYPTINLFQNFQDKHKNVFEGPYYDAVEHKGCIDHLSKIDHMWKELLIEANSREFITAFSNAVNIPFNSVRNFSFKRGAKGSQIKPHLDQASHSKNPHRSRIVCMFYFGEKDGYQQGGTTIYDRDKSTVLLEAPSMRNTMLFFQQHPDAWHGYKPIEENTQRSAIAITFQNSPTPMRIKTSLIHQCFCQVKNFLARA